MTTLLEPAVWRTNPLRLFLFVIPAALLLAPAVAMRFSNEVQWTAFDFAFAAILLFGSAGLADLTMRRTGSWSFRLGAGFAVANAFLLIWINGAVGIIGNEANTANLLFIGVVVLALIGSAIARFRARGMARAMYVAAAAQAAIAGATLAFGWGASEPPGLAGVVGLILAFALSWLLAGGLFARAAAQG